MKKLLFIIISLILFPNFALAAILYLEPAEASYYQGDSFITEIRIDSEEECINTVDVNLSFPKDILEVIDFSSGNSMISLWLNPPAINRNLGLISFTGGIPGGYCGILPGDPGKSNLLGKIIFKVKNQDENRAEINFLDNCQVLLNDGLGTPAVLKTQGAVLTILSGIPDTTKEEWREELIKDSTPPEPFEIEVSEESSVFGGKYFVTFSTQDKQTGVDFYEVKEGNKDWKRGESPYLLEDQNLTSIIKVKAVDKAGNERIAEYLPLRKVFPGWAIILILLEAGVILWLVYKYKLIFKK